MTSLKKIIVVCLVAASMAAAFSCKKNKVEPYLGYTFRFEKNAEEWMPFFSDYPVGKESQYELLFEYSTLPFPLAPNTPALQIHGNNHSDDLLSVVYRKFSGLEPGRTYLVSFRVELASNVSTDAVGIGGSPNLALGGGGIAYAPENLLDETGPERFNRPNFESRLQSHESNGQLKVLGNIGVAENTSQYTLITRDNFNDPLSLTANNSGDLWLMLATDSGFEGPITLYIKEIEVRIK